MRVVICGAGQVGYGIAERLASERNDVSVIDTSRSLVQNIRDNLDARGFVGHGAGIRLFIDGVGVEMAGGAPAVKHRIGVVEDEEACRVLVVAVVHEFVIVGMGVADMGDRGEPDGAFGRQGAHVPGARRLADRLGVDEGRAGDQGGEGADNALLAFGGQGNFVGQASGASTDAR